MCSLNSRHIYIGVVKVFSGLCITLDIMTRRTQTWEVFWRVMYLEDTMVLNIGNKQAEQSTISWLLLFCLKSKKREKIPYMFFYFPHACQLIWQIMFIGWGGPFWPPRLMVSYAKCYYFTFRKNIKIYDIELREGYRAL